MARFIQDQESEANVGTDSSVMDSLFFLCVFICPDFGSLSSMTAMLFSHPPTCLTLRCFSAHHDYKE